jgi:hypothetical protein
MASTSGSSRRSQIGFLSTVDEATRCRNFGFNQASAVGTGENSAGESTGTYPLNDWMFEMLQ